MATEKACTRCLRVLPLEDFQRRANTPDHRQFWCRSCVSEVNKQWYAAHKAKKAAEAARRYQTDPAYRASILEASHQRQVEHGAEISAKKRARVDVNREQVRAYHRQYRIEHRDEINAKKRARRAAKRGADHGDEECPTKHLA